MTTVIAKANGQSLIVQPIESQMSEQTEMVVNLTGSTSATALQFNLKLPTDLTINASNATLGDATDGHTLNVQTLDNGDLLFILYSMDFKAFKDGELLRIPITAGNTETTSSGKLYTVRTATVDAVSHTCEDATFNVKVTEKKIVGDVNNDGIVDISDYIGVANHILGNTPEGFNVIAADVNNDGTIDISDYIGVANIILTGKP